MGKNKEESSKAPLLRQFFVTAGVVLNVTGNGCVIGVPAIMIPSLRLPGDHVHPTPSEESWIASVLGFALIAGNIIITPSMGILGRKKSHIMSTIPILAGWFLMILADSVPLLIISRILQGISMGMLGPLASIIIGEMTDPTNRGMFLTGVSLALSMGILFVQSIGTFLTWQQTCLISSFITFISLIMIIFSPESPSWLISKGRIDEARGVYQWLRGRGAKQDEELEKMIKAQQMIRKMSEAGVTLPLSKRIRRSLTYFCETYKKPEFYKPIIIMLHVYTMFQFSGTNVFSTYMTDIITQVVGGDINAKLWMVIFNVERLLCNLICVFLMRSMKRRTLIFSTVSICIAMYVCKSLYIYLKQIDMLPYDSKWIPLSIFGIYVFGIIGLGSVSLSLSGEIFPLEYRGLGSGISVFGLSFNFFVAVKCFAVFNQSMGLSYTYLFYAVVLLYTTVVIGIMLPETKDRTLQDIEDTFRGKTGIEDRRASEPLKPEEIEYALLRRCSSAIIH